MAGWRIEPPVSVPVAAGARRAATAAARAAGRATGHALGVPGVAHGLGAPKPTGAMAEFSLALPMANSSQLSLPSVTKPALGQAAPPRWRQTASGSPASMLAGGGGGKVAGDEHVFVRQSARRPGGRPGQRPSAASAAWAWARVASSSMRHKGAQVPACALARCQEVLGRFGGAGVLRLAAARPARPRSNGADR